MLCQESLKLCGLWKMFRLLQSLSGCSWNKEAGLYKNVKSFYYSTWNSKHDSLLPDFTRRTFSHTKIGKRFQIAGKQLDHFLASFDIPIQVYFWKLSILSLTTLSILSILTIQSILDKMAILTTFRSWPFIRSWRFFNFTCLQSVLVILLLT